MMTDPAPVLNEKAEHIFFGVGLKRAPPSKLLPANQVEFEKVVIENIAQQYPDFGDIIREQFDTASIPVRWGSGAGFHTIVCVPETARPLPASAENPLSSEAYVLRDVQPPLAPADKLPTEHRSSGLCGAILFHREGFIRHLDCHNYGNGWPEDEYVHWFLA